MSGNEMVPLEDYDECLTPNEVEAQRKWSDKTFGKGQRTEGVLKHIEEEVAEVRENPDHLDEWADLLILVLDGVTRRGWTFGQLLNGYRRKMRENRKRTWPPIPEGGFPEDVPVNHVRVNAPKMKGQRSQGCFVDEAGAFSEDDLDYLMTLHPKSEGQVVECRCVEPDPMNRGMLPVDAWRRCATCRELIAP